MQNIEITIGESHGVPLWPPSEIGINSRMTAAVPRNKPRKSIFATVWRKFNFGMFVGRYFQLAITVSMTVGDRR